MSSSLSDIGITELSAEPGPKSNNPAMALKRNASEAFPAEASSPRLLRPRLLTDASTTASMPVQSPLATIKRNVRPSKAAVTADARGKRHRSGGWIAGANPLRRARGKVAPIMNMPVEIREVIFESCDDITKACLTLAHKERFMFLKPAVEWLNNRGRKIEQSMAIWEIALSGDVIGLNRSTKRFLYPLLEEFMTRTTTAARAVARKAAKEKGVPFEGRQWKAGVVWNKDKERWLGHKKNEEVEEEKREREREKQEREREEQEREREEREEWEAEEEEEERKKIAEETRERRAEREKRRRQRRKDVICEKSVMEEREVQYKRDKMSERYDFDEMTEEDIEELCELNKRERRLLDEDFESLYPKVERDTDDEDMTDDESAGDDENDGNDDY